MPGRLRILYPALAFVTFACVAACQTTSRIEPTGASEYEAAIFFWYFPKYKTFSSLQNYEPLTSGKKFKIAFEDSLDRGTFASAAGFGGLGQLTDGKKTFGQVVTGID